MPDGILGFLSGSTSHRPATINDFDRAFTSITRTERDATRAAASTTNIGNQYEVQNNRYRIQGINSDTQLERAEAANARAHGYGNYGPQQQYGTYSPQQQYGTYGPQPMRGGNGAQRPGVMESQLVGQLVLASEHPENPQFAQAARAMADQMRGPDGMIHLKGYVRNTIDGRSVSINFGSGTSDTMYSSFDALQQDIAHKTGMAYSGPAAGASLAPTGHGSTRTPLQQERDLVTNGMIDPRTQSGQPVPPAPGVAHVATADAPATIAGRDPHLTNVSYTPAHEATHGQPVPAAAPATTPGAAAAAPATHEATPAAHAPAAVSPEQKAINQQAQLYLERMKLSTGNKNDRVASTMAADENSATRLDGIVGPKTTAAIASPQLQGLHIDPQHITPDDIAKLKAASEAYMHSRVTQHAAPTPAAPVPATAEPATHTSATPATPTAPAPAAPTHTAPVHGPVGGTMDPGVYHPSPAVTPVTTIAANQPTQAVQPNIGILNRPLVVSDPTLQEVQPEEGTVARRATPAVIVRTTAPVSETITTATSSLGFGGSEATPPAPAPSQSQALAATQGMRQQVASITVPEGPGNVPNLKSGGTARTV